MLASRQLDPGLQPEDDPGPKPTAPIASSRRWFTASGVGEEAQLLDSATQGPLMAILGSDSYDWYAYQAKQACVLESARGQTGVLVKGSIFGARLAKSDKHAWRLILKELGPRTIFSLEDAEAKAVLKKSRSVEAEALRPGAKAKKLGARLEQIDPGDFWSVVAALDWPKSSKDSRYLDIARTALRERFRAQELARLGNAAGKNRRELQKAVERLEKQEDRQLFLGGDDSFYDALAHAVSSGQQVFEGFVLKPESFVRKYNRAPIESENFESCFM